MRSKTDYSFFIINYSLEHGKDLTKSGLQSVGKNIDDVENQTLQLISALRKVRAEQQKIMQDNIHSGKNYSQDLARIQALTGRINRLEVGLREYKKVQQDISNNPGYIDIDTEAVTRKTNNLKMQFSQVARELPSLAMGPQMFITSCCIRTKGCAGMETAGQFNIQLADGTCGRHIAGYCVWKGYCKLGKRAYQR